MAVRRLHKDPRWPAFVERYAFDLVRFAAEVVGLSPTFQQIEIYESVQDPGSRTSVASGHGCFAAGTPIMLASGDVIPVEDVRAGDRLMGGDGASGRNVVSLRRGREPMYRFEYMDGTSHVFNESHILCLVATNSKGRRKAGARTTVTVREWLTWGEDKRRCHAIYRSRVDVFEGESSPLPIDPYILGIWLGDGTSAKAAITTEDPEIVEAGMQYARSLPGVSFVPGCKRGNAVAYSFSLREGKGRRINPLLEKLRGLNLLGSKHIPAAYMRASRRDRLELLAGLIDTDGHRDSGSGGIDFIQKNEGIARGVWWIARSVGCHATISPVRKMCVNNGVVGDYWRVTIGRNTETIPTRIARKRAPDRDRQRPNLHFGIRSCVPLGEGDYFGFELDGDRKFLGGDFTVLHNTGKSAGSGVIVLWHLLCYFQSNTVITAPKIAQVQSVIWKEITDSADRIERGPHGWIRQYFVVETEKIYVAGYKAQWFVEAKTAPRGAPENLAGYHRDWLLFIVDEASGVPDANFSTITGALTDQRNRMLMQSQPTRPAGFFYDTHHSLSTEMGGKWTSIRLDSEESPLVSPTWVVEKLREYGGSQSPEYRIRVKGQFPEQSDKYLLGRGEAERCFDRRRVTAGLPWGWMILVDVGAGEYRDKSVISVARVWGHDLDGPNARRVDVVAVPVCSNTIQLPNLCGHIVDLTQQLSNPTVLVDAGGYGLAVYQRLVNELNVGNCHKVLWGNPVFRKEYKKRFFNQRALAMYGASRAAREGRLTISAGNHKRELLDQMARVPYHFDELARYVVESKGSKEWEGLPSPDIWDSICFSFLMESAHYIQAETKAAQGQAGRQAALDAAADAFSGA